MIVVHPHTEIAKLEGGEHLESVRWQNNQTEQCRGTQDKTYISHDWCHSQYSLADGCVVLDDKGFIKTGRFCRQKILAPHDGPSHVLLTCWKPVCRAFLRWATSEAAALNALLLPLAKDQLQFHLFTKYSKNNSKNDDYG